MALAMLLPATMLTTACSSDDNIVNNEPAIKKGYQLPVTVNVTRQGDATTRASYNESTKKLSFSTGDQLFVEGEENTAGCFAGALTWTSGGTFSGTIITGNEYTGTFNDLFTAASAGDYNYIRATLLPAGYENYGFLYIEGSESEAYVDYSEAKAFAATKALAVEQFSAERTDSYDNGFALEPAFAILNFTITGLSASTEVAVALQYNVGTISGSVTTDGSGTATFAMAVTDETLTQWISSLTVDGNAITIGSGTTLAAGHIYNIERSVE